MDIAKYLHDQLDNKIFAPFKYSKDVVNPLSSGI